MQIKIFNSRKLNDTREFNLALATNNLKEECFIGRSPTSSLVLDSADVSRLHGKFFQQNGNYYFIDIGSRNCSIINGKLAEIDREYLLKPGDVLRVGEFVLILEEMDVIRQDLADTVFGSVAPNTIPSEGKATFIQLPQLSADTTFERSTATDLNIGFHQEPPLFTTEQSTEIEIFISSVTLTEAEKIAISDRPTHIEVFDEIPQVSVTSLKEIDQFPVSHKKEVDPVLERDPWQDFESELEIASALTENQIVVPEKAAVFNIESTIATEKYMALMAHDRQKPELAQFVARHQGFFCQNLTIATPTTSITLQQAGLKVTAETPALPIGGYQAIANLVNSGNVLAVILLKDILELPPSEQENETALIRACNLNQVLLATNLATAEAIVHFLTLGAP